MTDERTARMGLAAASNAGDLGLARLVEEQGAVEIWDHLRSGQGRTQLAARAAGIDLDALVHQTRAVGARFLIPGDEQWPAQVQDLAWSEPVGSVGGGAPLGLWVAGPADPACLAQGVSIVGSRASTAYGEHVCADWAAGIAQKGRPVVSGGAYGIDACAHRGALAEHGITVAVMAGGLGQLYPPGNSSLLQKVRETGAVISEYPPSCPPSRPRFLVRNRLIAALSAATVIVEGAVRSGAQNTVSWALSLQRPVIAVPGPVTSAMSVTPHRLIRNGEAILATTAEEVLDVIEPMGCPAPGCQAAPPTLFDDLTSEQKKIHDALPARRAVCVDELSALTGESALSVLVALAQLKHLGLASESTSGMWKLQPHAL